MPRVVEIFTEAQLHTIASRLDQIREAWEMSPRDMAIFCGIKDLGAIYRFGQGQHPTRRTVRLIENAIGCNLEKLLRPDFQVPPKPVDTTEETARGLVRDLIRDGRGKQLVAMLRAMKSAIRVTEEHS